MNWRKFLPEDSQPAWGGLFWAVPMVYIFLNPYQQHAGWMEWTLTFLAFAVFISLYTLGLIFWTHKRVLRKVCIGVMALAMVFTAYRFTGVIFFPLVAAFVPFTVDGHVPLSAAALAGIVGILLGEWWLLGLPWNPFPMVIASEALLIGAGTTFVARQTLTTARLHRVSERERIARDLHDILGHTLSVIALKSELAGRLLHQDPVRTQAEIGDIERISRRALAEVREAIVGYRAGDLHAEFERAQSTLATAGIVVERHCEHVAIPPMQERILTLVLREAVTNIVRHAQAGSCRLRLREIDGACRLEIHDDGRGGIHTEGLGIRGMRERVEAIGGSVAWDAGPGTRLKVTLPLAASVGDDDQ